MKPTHRSYASLLALPAVLALAASALAGPYDTWAKYRTVSVNTSAAIGGANVDSAQANFPLLVRLSDASAAVGADVLTGSLTTGGLDVRFTDSTGQVPLSFERERWSPTGAEFWVKIPVVAPLSVTKIRMYWGKAAQANLSTPSAVFDTAAKFGGVWHMNGADSAANEADATQNGLHAAQQGRPAQVPGAIGLSRLLDTAGTGAGLSRITLSTATGLGITPNAVHFINTRTGWAVGTGGAIRKTVNGGAAWTSQTSGTTTRALKGILFAGPNLGFAVGDSGTLLKTVNGGTTWTAATKDSATSRSLNGVTFSGNSLAVLVAVGDSGTAYRSTDTGATWLKTASLGITNNFTSIASERNTPGVVIAVGDSSGRGVVRRIRTPQANATWDAPANASPSLRSIAWAVNGNTFVAVGDSGVIRRSSNAGSTTMTWSSVANPAGVNALRSIYGSTGMLYAVGDSGKVLRSQNQGSAFIAQTSGTPNNLTAVSAFYAVGASSTVARLDDYQYFAVDGSALHPATAWPEGGKYSVSGWFRASTAGKQRMLVHKGEYQGGLGLDNGGGANGQIELVEFRGSPFLGWRGRHAGAANIPTGATWTHVTAVRDGDSNLVRMYVNGVLQAGGVVAYDPTIPRIAHRDIFFGRAQDATGGPRLWQGGLDEIQISSTNRSTGWAKLTYATQRGDSSVVTLGTSDTPPPPAAEVYSEWAQHRDVWLNTQTNGASVTGDLRNFPVLVRLGVADSSVFNQSVGRGIDVRFTKVGDAVRLKHQVETWDSAGRKAAIWVKVDTLKGSFRNRIRMHYGKAGVDDSSNGAAVFDTAQNYQAVFHMNGAAGDTIRDASGNRFVGVPGSRGSGTLPADTAGIIGRGKLFSGVAGTGNNGGMYTLPGTASGKLNFPEGAPRTLSVWAYLNLSKPQSILNKGDLQYQLAAYAAAEPYWFEGTELQGEPAAAKYQPVRGLEAPTTQTWHHVTWTMTGVQSAGTLAESLYVNGALLNTEVTFVDYNTTRNEGYNVAIGAMNAGTVPGAPSTATRWFSGMLDEVRISNNVRGAAWVKAEYENQKAAQTLVSWVEPQIVISIAPGAPMASTGFLSLQHSSQGLLFRVGGDNAARQARLTLVDMWGRTVWTRSLDLRESRQAFWNGQQSAAGLYVLRATLIDANGKTLQSQDRKIPFSR